MKAALFSPNFFSKRAGFSLIEIVLAIAIIAFALVGILGLFPVALDSAQSSQQETQAAFIARSIFSDLTSMAGPTTYVVSNKEYFNDQGGGGSNGKIDINLSTTGKKYIAYDSDGSPLKEIASSDFSSGVGNSGFLASIAVTTSDSDPQIPEGLAKVVITVEMPGAAPTTKRNSYPFVSLLNQN